MIQNICFYNHWHNGDVFAGKAFIQMIQRACPQFNYSYALHADPYIIKDLNCVPVSISSLPTEISDKQMGVVNDQTVYLNTWIGAYLTHTALPGEQHANYPNLYRMWNNILNTLNNICGTSMALPDNIWCAVPVTDWNSYNLEPAVKFLNNHPAQKRLLFCNGAVRSGQSEWYNMDHVIEDLAQNNLNWQFICTKSFETQAVNIQFTDYIFQQACDINEIAWLSTHCDLIWGKNSGPFMFCHVPENVFNPHKVFLACSDRSSDSYVHGCPLVPCHYYHSLTKDPFTLMNQIYQVLDYAKDNQPAFTMKVLT